MDKTLTDRKTCPTCRSDRYAFRFRKKIATEDGEVIETKFRCKACQHEWKVRVPTQDKPAA